MTKNTVHSKPTATSTLTVSRLRQIFFFGGSSLAIIMLLLSFRIAEKGLSVHSSFLPERDDRQAELNDFLHANIGRSQTTYKKAHLDDRLEFLHITKTAGSAIEEAAAQVDMSWGLCHIESRPALGPGCRNPDWLFLLKTGQLRTKKSVGGIGMMELWHVPPLFFQHNPYNGSATFTVVRNPYDRVISEFYCKYFGFNQEFHRISRNNVAKGTQQINNSLPKPQQKVETPKYLNEWVVTQITTLSSKLQQETPAFESAHLLPQHYYIFDGDGNRIVDHVLRYETLHRDFPRLMKTYQLSIALSLKSRENTNVAIQSGKRMGTKDLAPETIKMINKFFENDFRLLGYGVVIADEN